MSEIIIGLVVIGAVFLLILWYLHRQHTKERHTHAQELTHLRHELTTLQQSHHESINQREQQHQVEIQHYHNQMTTKQAEHLDEIKALQQQITALKEEFGTKQLATLTEHQHLLEQKQHTISELNQRLMEQETAFKLSLDKAIKDAQTRSNNAQRHVIKGQISEKFVPFMAGFEYSPADCRFMGEPIDYVVFHRLHDCVDGQASFDEVSVVFLEVKTGQAKLNKRQQVLKEVIARGQVKFETLRIHQSDNMGDEVRVSVDVPYVSPDKQLYPNSGAKWSEEEELRLIHAFDNGASIDELMARHGRNHGGIMSRLKKLGKFQE